MLMNRRRRQRARGFTFLEIMFVVVIIGILLALVGPRLLGRSEKARVTATEAQISNLSTAIKNFEIDLGRLPKKLDDLIEDPGVKGWDGPYLSNEELPQDPWGNEFYYKSPGEHNKRSFDLWSAGGDGEEGSDDDIGNWRRTKD